MMPFGGKYQDTPSQAMVHKISTEHGDTDTVSFMAWGYNPYIAEKSPYHSAYLAVVESVSKLIGAGASYEDVYLTFQEYFEKPLKDGKRWGKPLAALLGAYKAQMNLGVAAIGGKDSMSGSFEDLDVPPTSWLVLPLLNSRLPVIRYIGSVLITMKTVCRKPLPCWLCSTRSTGLSSPVRLLPYIPPDSAALRKLS